MGEPRLLTVPSLPADPDLGDERVVRARSLHRDGSHRQARELLFAVLRDRPGSPVALIMLTESYVATKEWTSVIQFADATLRIRPGQAKAHHRRGHALYLLGRHREARDSMTLATAYGPNAVRHWMLALICLHIPTDEARLAALRAIREGRRMAATPQFAIYLEVVRAQALGKLGATRTARDEFARLTAAHPDQTIAATGAMDLEAAALHFAEATRYADQLVALNAADAPAAAARRRAASLFTRWSIPMALYGSLGTAAAAAAQYWLHRPIGELCALGALIAYLGVLIRSGRRTGRSPARMVVASVRQAGALLGLALIAATVAAQVTLVVRPALLLHGPGVAVLVGSGVLALNGVVGLAILGEAAALRWRHARRHRHAIAEAIAPDHRPPAGHTRYDIDLPAPGRLMLTSLPDEPAAVVAWGRSLVHGDASVIVSSVREETGLQRMFGRLADTPDGRPLRFISFPIGYGKAPSEPEVTSLLDELVDLVYAGDTVVIFCSNAAERSAMLAAAVLVRFGFDVDAAWSRVARARGVEPIIAPAQRDWVAGLPFRR